jgi:uncharacterized lipoprotein YehR (DUF1307 family)
MNLNKLKEEIDELKIQIGIEKRQIGEKEKQLSKLGINNPEEAKKKLDLIDSKITRLEKKREKLIKKATTILESIEDEDCRRTDTNT